MFQAVSDAGKWVSSRDFASQNSQQTSWCWGLSRAHSHSRALKGSGSRIGNLSARFAEPAASWVRCAGSSAWQNQPGQQQFSQSREQNQSQPQQPAQSQAGSAAVFEASVSKNLPSVSSRILRSARRVNQQQQGSDQHQVLQQNQGSGSRA